MGDYRPFLPRIAGAQLGTSASDDMLQCALISFSCASHVNELLPRLPIHSPGLPAFASLGFHIVGSEQWAPTAERQRHPIRECPALPLNCVEMRETAMKSAAECVCYANRCEHMASDARDPIDQAVLLATADHWRHLAGVAKSKELVEAQEPWPADRDTGTPRSGR